MPLATYYLNCSVAGPTDAAGLWTNDANAFDGSLLTFASTTFFGDDSTSFLRGDGTNAPGTGTAISQVRCRIYGTAANTSGSWNLVTEVYTAGLGQLLGAPAQIIGNSPVAGYGSYVTLPAPTAGWDWPTLQGLVVKIYTDGFLAGTKSATIYIVELLVASAPDTIGVSTTTGIQSITF